MTLTFFIDAALQRQPFYRDANLIWKANEQKVIAGYVTTACLTDLFYLVNQKRTTAVAFRAVRICVDTFRLCTVSTNEVKQALHLAGDDFEDNLQLACAISYQLDAIVTRDKGFPKLGLPILTPAALLRQIGR